MLGIRKGVCALSFETGNKPSTWELAKHTLENTHRDRGRGGQGKANLRLGVGWGKFMLGTWQRRNNDQSLVSRLLLNRGNCNLALL